MKRRRLISGLIAFALAVQGCGEAKSGFESAASAAELPKAKGFSLGTIQTGAERDSVSNAYLQAKLGENIEVQQLDNLQISPDFEKSRELDLSEKGLKVLSDQETIIRIIFLGESLRIGQIQSTSSKVPLCLDGSEAARCGQQWGVVLPKIESYIKERHGPELTCVDAQGQRVELSFVKEMLAEIKLLAPRSSK